MASVNATVEGQKGSINAFKGPTVVIPPLLHIDCPHTTVHENKAEYRKILKRRRWRRVALMRGSKVWEAEGTDGAAFKAS